MQKKDIPEVKRVTASCLKALFKCKTKNLGNYADDIVRFKEAYLDKGGTYLVAVDKGKIIGTAAIVPEKGKGRIHKMYLLKKYRGKGVGSALYNEIEKFCKKKGFKELILSTYPHFKEAIKMYKAKGFRQFKKTEKQLFFRKRI